VPRPMGSIFMLGATLSSLCLAGCDELPARAPDARRDRSGLDAPPLAELGRVDRELPDGPRRERLAGPDQGVKADKATTADTGGAPKAGTIVPLYAYPTHVSWTQIVQAKQANLSVPVVAIVNVNNGPGSAVEPAFATAIPKLAAAGIVVIGYVYTSYGKRDPATVKAEIGQWKSFYSQVSGIFFDEQAVTSGLESYYKGVGGHAKALGLALTVGNPGTDIPQSYIGALDTFLIYETAGLPSLASLGGWHAGVDKASFGIIPYAVSTLDATFVASAKKTIGYIYITSDDLPNPWDSLPSYFAQLLTELGK
jgi:hypothetical protein